MLTESEYKFARRAIRRKKLFLILSLISITVGLCLIVIYSWKASTQPDFDIAPRFVIVLLILLAARQNLRQYKYAKILEKLISCEGISADKEPPDNVLNSDR